MKISWLVKAWQTKNKQTNNKDKPVGELGRALISFKRPLLSVDVMVGMYDSVERYPVYPANFTPPMRASVFYTACCKAGNGSCRHHKQYRIFCEIAVAPKCFFSQSSEAEQPGFNTMFYDSVCLKGLRITVSECNDFEYCDITIITS